jgi:hypothetical protein
MKYESNTFISAQRLSERTVQVRKFEIAFLQKTVTFQFCCRDRDFQHQSDLCAVNWQASYVSILLS